MIRTAPRSRTVSVRVRRQSSPKEPGHFERFDVPVEPGANVISLLQWIAANPVTADGTRTTPINCEVACLEEVCGSCTMLVNGRVRQSCSALVDEYAPNDGDEITLEPMSKFPVIRDLMVDRTRMFRSLERIKAWVPIDGTYDLGPGPQDTPEHQQERYRMSTCMTCGCCVEACPQFHLEEDPETWDRDFIGAHAINAARLFNEHGTGKVLEGDRLDVLMGVGGVNDCGNAQNCVKVCPKEIPLTESIASIGRAVTVHGVKKFFG